VKLFQFGSQLSQASIYAGTINDYRFTYVTHTESL